MPKETLLIFAPDLLTLETVRAVLEELEAEEATTTLSQQFIVGLELSGNRSEWGGDKLAGSVRDMFGVNAGRRS